MKSTNDILNEIRNNLRKGDMIDNYMSVIMSMLYELEDYFDYSNETITKVIDLLQNAKELN